VCYASYSAAGVEVCDGFTSSDNDNNDDGDNIFNDNYSLTINMMKTDHSDKDFYYVINEEDDGYSDNDDSDNFLMI
jgi:hypothetical protein